MKYLPIVVLVIALFAGCSDSSEPTDTGSTAEDVSVTDGAASDMTTAGKTFGEPCGDNEECESGVCHEFGQGGSQCTITCGFDDDCPDGSEGKKCNNKGTCKP